MVVSHEGYRDLGTEILFKGDPNLDESGYSAAAIHLEEARIKEQTVLFGRFDIILQPVGN